MFDITLDRRGRLVDATGEIVIGDFRAHVSVDLQFWTLEDYRASWRRSAAAVLEQGFGRFLISVGPPASMFETWPCWRRGDDAMLLHSILLSTLTTDFARTEDAELYDPAPPEADRTVKLYRCSLADIADFERRLSGASAQ